MAWRILLLISLAAWPWAGRAQVAEDYFHRGAQFYVFGEKTNAMRQVYTGLQLFPTNEPLRELAGILAKEQEKQQQQQQNQQGEENKEKQQQDSKSQQSQGDKSKSDEKQQAQEQKDQSDQAKPDPQQAQAGEKKDKDDEAAKESGEPVQAHAMTPQEAKQLLDAQKSEEKVLQFQPQGESKPRTKPIKDW